MHWHNWQLPKPVKYSDFSTKFEIIPHLFCKGRWKENILRLHHLDCFFYLKPTGPIIRSFPADDMILK